MKNDYKDIRDKLGEPQWWDEEGVPRYCKFRPDAINNIYAREAALVEIACQSCCHQFKVAISTPIWAYTGALAKAIVNHAVCYGDPPNIGCCPAGPTMTSETIAVLEYWTRIDGEWKSDPSFAIRFPSL